MLMRDVELVADQQPQQLQHFYDGDSDNQMPSSVDESVDDFDLTPAASLGESV